MLNKDRLKTLMEVNIKPARTFDYSTKVLYSRQKSMVDFNIKPDAFLTPLLWADNTNLNRNVQVCVGDMPKIARLERLAN